MRPIVGIGIASIIVLGVVPRLWAHGDLDGRIAAVTVQLQTNGSAAELWLMRADLQRQHGDFIPALADVRQASMLKTNWPAAHLQRARIAADMEKFPECIRAAADCLALDSGNPDAHILRARALVRLGSHEPAIADYDAVLDAPDAAAPLPDLYLERARACAAQKHFSAALRGLDSGMERMGRTPPLALAAIGYERDRGNFSAALARLDAAKNFFRREDFEKLRAEIITQSRHQ